jgi:hypothetical protein
VGHSQDLNKSPSTSLQVLTSSCVQFQIKRLCYKSSGSNSLTFLVLGTPRNDYCHRNLRQSRLEVHLINDMFSKVIVLPWI